MSVKYKSAFAFALTAFAAAAPVHAAATIAGNVADYVTNGGFEQVSRTRTATTSAGAQVANYNFEFGASSGAAGTVAGWNSPATNAYNLLFNAATASNATTGSAVGRFNGSASGAEALWRSSASSQGGNFVALDGDSDYRGALTQSLSGLTVGKLYTLSFEWAAAELRSRSGDTVQQLYFGLGNAAGDPSSFVAYTTDQINLPSQSFSGWNTVTQTFTATGVNQTLAFLAVGTPQGLPPMTLLDNVKFTTAVPEPASWAMMVGGFGLVGGAMRARRRTGLATAA